MLPASDAESQIAVTEKKRSHSHAHAARDEDDDEHAHDVAAQVIGIGILEFGVILHRYAFVYCESWTPLTDSMLRTSVLIGLTLAVDPNFKVLFVVLVFHRTCMT